MCDNHPQVHRPPPTAASEDSPTAFYTYMVSLWLIGAMVLAYAIHEHAFDSAPAPAMRSDAGSR